MTHSTVLRQEGLARKTQEQGGQLHLLSRLLASPPDAIVLQDAEAVGLIDAGWRRGLEAVQIEFSRLFSVPGPDAIAAHQSIYTDVLELEPSGPDTFGCGRAFAGGQFQGYLGGKSCSEAGRWYVLAGFEPRDPSLAMADHISTQLDFLGYLFLAESRACETGDREDMQSFQELRGQFHAQFLGKWIERFGEKLAANGVSELYRRLGRCLLSISWERT